MTDKLLMIFIVIALFNILFNVIAMVSIGKNVTERCETFLKNQIYLNDRINEKKGTNYGKEKKN